jgi:predicted O-methyltransferase YrrM
MPELTKTLMQKLYGRDIWQGFRPAAVSTEVQGWNGNHTSLKRLTSSEGAKIVVDVGVWKGQSTITMAHAMRSRNIDGCVIAIDTFLGSAEHWSGPLSLFEREHGRPDLYKTFLSNVWEAGLTDYVIPMPQTSVTSAVILARLGVTASVIHVDAAHEYDEVMRDAVEYWKLLKPGGYLIGDDYSDDSWPGVLKAAGEFSAKVGRALVIEPPKWILRKK